MDTTLSFLTPIVGTEDTIIAGIVRSLTDPLFACIVHSAGVTIITFATKGLVNASEIGVTTIQRTGVIIFAPCLYGRANAALAGISTGTNVSVVTSRAIDTWQLVTRSGRRVTGGLHTSPWRVTTDHNRRLIRDTLTVCAAHEASVAEISIIKGRTIGVSDAWTCLFFTRHTHTLGAGPLTVAGDSIITRRTASEQGARARTILAAGVLRTTVPVITDHGCTLAYTGDTAIRVRTHIAIVTAGEVGGVCLFTGSCFRVTGTGLARIGWGITHDFGVG